MAMAGSTAAASAGLSCCTHTEPPVRGTFDHQACRTAPAFIGNARIAPKPRTAAIFRLAPLPAAIRRIPGYPAASNSGTRSPAGDGACVIRGQHHDLPRTQESQRQAANKPAIASKNSPSTCHVSRVNHAAARTGRPRHTRVAGHPSGSCRPSREAVPARDVSIWKRRPGRRRPRPSVWPSPVKWLAAGKSTSDFVGYRTSTRAPPHAFG